MPLVFGIDIGTTSIGFAAISMDEARETGRILRMGVRIFPEARDPKGTPLNQTRRQKRMMRRQLPPPPGASPFAQRMPERCRPVAAIRQPGLGKGDDGPGS